MIRGERRGKRCCCCYDEVDGDDDEFCVVEGEVEGR